MDKHWQQLEQEATRRMATYHQERAKAHYEQQVVTRHFKTAMRTVRDFIWTRFTHDSRRRKQNEGV